jgi:anti-sigma regulatory factor (Ser/Thr protein kinase)
VTELVANVVLHASSPAELTIRRIDDVVYIGVADGEPRPPIRLHRSPLAESGRGLAIVEALAESWGYDMAPGTGKVVWFELRSHPSTDCGSRP